MDRTRGCSAGWWAVACVLVVVVISGCGGGSSPEPENTTRTEAESRLTPSGPLVPGEGVVAFGGVLFGVTFGPSNPELLRSEDGMSWDRVSLPGVPDRVQFDVGGPRVTGDVLSLTGREVRGAEGSDSPSSGVPDGTFLMWTTPDGINWEAGPQIEGLPAYTTPPLFDADGVLTVGASTVDGRFVLMLSDGAEWEPGEVAGLELAPGASAELDALWSEHGDSLVGRVTFSSPPERRFMPSLIRSGDRGRTWFSEPCVTTESEICHTGLSADGLLVRGMQSSTDAGSSWSTMTIDDPANGFCDGRFRTITRVDTGWVAVADAYSLGEGTDASLLFSADGTSWTVVRSSGGRCGTGGRVYFYRDPLVFDGQVWTVHSLGHLSGEPSSATLLRSTDGRTWTEVTNADLSGGSSGAPLEFQGKVVVPVYDDEDGLLSYLAVVA